MINTHSDVIKSLEEESSDFEEIYVFYLSIFQSQCCYDSGIWEDVSEKRMRWGCGLL